MFEKYLSEIGLSAKEIKVYTSTLELGESSILEISKKSKVNRTTIYPIIESLRDKGLISMMLKGKKQTFYAESPEKLKIYVDSKIRDLETKKGGLEAIIKQLGAIENRRSDKPVVRFYEGSDGINTMLEEFLESNEKILNPDAKENKMYISYSRDLQEKIAPKVSRDYRREIRNKSGVKSVYLYTKKEGELISDALRERIKVDSKKYPLSAHIAVLKDKIRLISYSKNTGILIIDSELAETLRSIMQLAVKGAEKLK